MGIGKAQRTYCVTVEGKEKERKWVQLQWVLAVVVYKV
jgi:hypothetical protein